MSCIHSHYTHVLVHPFDKHLRMPTPYQACIGYSNVQERPGPCLAQAHRLVGKTDSNYTGSDNALSQGLGWENCMTLGAPMGVRKSLLGKGSCTADP